MRESWLLLLYFHYFSYIVNQKTKIFFWLQYLLRYILLAFQLDHQFAHKFGSSQLDHTFFSPFKCTTNMSEITQTNFAVDDDSQHDKTYKLIHLKPRYWPSVEKFRSDDARSILYTYKTDKYFLSIYTFLIILPAGWVDRYGCPILTYIQSHPIYGHRFNNNLSQLNGSMFQIWRKMAFSKPELDNTHWRSSRRKQKKKMKNRNFESSVNKNWKELVQKNLIHWEKFLTNFYRKAGTVPYF